MSADGQFRFMHKAYKKAWAYLNYALDKGEGFVLIAGRPGTGKTTLIQDTLSELDNERIKPVKLISNQLQGEELLRLVALELGLQAQDFDKATLLTRIEQYALMLHQEQRRLVVIVDEAQNLSANGLEELRLLSNLQTGNQPLFQIVLIGQEELRSLVYGQAMENITQRIVASCNLEPMPTEHVQGYVEHRLGIVGWNGDPEFDPGIFEPLQRVTHGVPRDINLVMARLLLYGALEEKRQLSRDDLITVLKELGAEQRLAVDQIALVDEISEELEREAADGSSELEAVASDGIAKTSEAEDLQQEEVLGQRATEAAGSDNASEYSDADKAPDEVAWPGPEEDIPAFYSGQSQTEKSHRDEEASDQLAETDGDDPQRIESKSVDEVVEDDVDTEMLEDEAVAVSGSPAPDGLVETDFEEQSEIDQLPAMQALPIEEQNRPHGLLTDVDELLGESKTRDSAPARLWRWIFYPLAIGLLVIALLAVRYPDSMGLFWVDVREWVAQFIEDVDLKEPSRKPRQSTQHSIKTEADAADLPDAAVEQSVSLKGDNPEYPAEASGAEPAKARELRRSEPEPKPLSMPSPDATDVDLLVASQRGFRLQFDADSKELTAEGKALFDQLLQRLRAEPSLFVVLTGVSANQSATLQGIRDALRQAESVSHLLMREGIAQERIGIEGRVSVKSDQSHTVEVSFK